MSSLPSPPSPLTQTMRHHFRLDRLRLEQLRLLSYEHALLAKSITTVTSASAAALATADSPARVAEIRENRDLALGKIEGLRREFRGVLREEVRVGLERIGLEEVHSGEGSGSSRGSEARSSPWSTPGVTTPLHRPHTPGLTTPVQLGGKRVLRELTAAERAVLVNAVESRQRARRNLTSSLQAQERRGGRKAYVEDE